MDNFLRAKNLYKRLFIGVDFDGTIVESAFPGAGPIKQDTVDLMWRAREAGHCLIIWTARSGEDLVFAKNFLDENNIPYDYINENPEDPFHIAGSQGRKLHFNMLIDDTAINVANVKDAYNYI